MNEIKIDFNEKSGKIKPMNAVNNGPSGSLVRKTGNAVEYKELHIPYARLHDSAFYSGYGGEWTVDVHRIFRNFDADVNDACSYDFLSTDAYLKSIKDVGTEIFYRLGATIEHLKKYGTFPPKDFKKWAQVCEHIIMHYNYGWANGFEMNIKYWEIWNEPDCVNPDGSNPCWQGTEEQFFEFYGVVAKHLKNRFPELKIGGPAICYYDSGFAQKFLPYARKNEIPLDFFSFHCYAYTVDYIGEIVGKFRALLDENGYRNTETILNEWNYVQGWTGDNYKKTINAIMGLKGSSFVLGAMCVGQASSLDMLMYYDARPCSFNGIFGLGGGEKLKTYYIFKAFSELQKLGGYVKTQFDGENIYSVGATDGNEHAVLLTYYDHDEKEQIKAIKLNVKNACVKNSVVVEYYVIDEYKDLKLVREEKFTSNDFSVYLDIENFSSYLLKIKPIR